MRNPDDSDYDGLTRQSGARRLLMFMLGTILVTLVLLAFGPVGDFVITNWQVPCE